MSTEIHREIGETADQSGDRERIGTTFGERSLREVSGRDEERGRRQGGHARM